MSKFLISISLLLIGLTTSASEPENAKPYNLLTFRQIEVETPWLQFGNAAGLSQMPELFPSELKLEYEQTDGDYHSVFKGKTDQSINFSSRSFRKINKTYLYGMFSYRKSFEKGLNFSNTNDPSLNYPYLLADTIGHDTYNREFFRLEGTISSPVNSKIDWGLSFDYQVGVASQNRDPRPENKVMQSSISPGLLFKQDHYKIGANLTYSYYNEDIDVSLVEEGVQHTLFQLHGPGVFNYHASNSFYRLYQQHQLGGGFQMDLTFGHISNVLHSKYIYSIQTIDDGRKASSATWSAVKNDARRNGITWNLTDLFSIGKGQKVHQIKSELNIVSRLGTEFIQRLEKVSDTDLEHWITYGQDQKYYSLQTNAKLNYQLLAKDVNDLVKSLFTAGLGYWSFDEKYYLPNLELNYSNLMLESSYLKLFTLPRLSLFAELKLKYQFNLDREQNLTATNFMVQKVFEPEFNYLTNDFISPSVSVGCQLPLKQSFGKYFMKSDLAWYHSANGLNSTFVSFSTGIIF